MSTIDPLKKGATLEQLRRVQEYEDGKIDELKSDISLLSPPIISTSLPDATADNYARFCIVTTDETDRFFINLKTNGVYGWIELKQGSIPSGNDSAILGNAIIGTLILGKGV